MLERLRVGRREGKEGGEGKKMSRPDQPWDGSAMHQGLCPLGRQSDSEIYNGMSRRKGMEMEIEGEPRARGKSERTQWQNSLPYHRLSGDRTQNFQGPPGPKSLFKKWCFSPRL